MNADSLVEQVMRKIFPMTVSDGEPDELATRRIEYDIIPSAKVEIAHLVGIDAEKFDFSQPGSENALLLSWCFYEWHDALDDFEANYAAQIARCREKWAVRAHVEEKAAAEL